MELWIQMNIFRFNNRKENKFLLSMKNISNRLIYKNSSNNFCYRGIL